MDSVPWNYIIISVSSIIGCVIIYVLVSFLIKKHTNKKNQVIHSINSDEYIPINNKLLFSADQKQQQIKPQMYSYCQHTNPQDTVSPPPLLAVNGSSTLYPNLYFYQNNEINKNNPSHLSGYYNY
ncbi:hypothetical protein DICPUDRAFT_84561 [Dictyostelium purpureum]|uniref:Transmembrane protein n=1 Tax=Dictyostelium purpureum TaxID=5786 RepID=F1A312_DICPU|nr:uncharacterized protein DICPUDRAFT_84561 [Dictyostelium purpureum]EGC29420.1 hypothetical protein DICPUDRAFT_84561 [Dictyostelium purpureum]|eukprot:XP_003294058.1 hypothetical protein DICPUDRAFT_84561 [Dictyostelium purpureum]